MNSFYLVSALDKCWMHASNPHHLCCPLLAKLCFESCNLLHCFQASCFDLVCNCCCTLSWCAVVLQSCGVVLAVFDAVCKAVRQLLLQQAGTCGGRKVPTCGGIALQLTIGLISKYRNNVINQSGVATVRAGHPCESSLLVA